MQRESTIIALVLAASLTGCALRGKPKPAATPAAPKAAANATLTPPAPPPALSEPQTQVQLPAPQPVNPEALATVPPKEEPPAEAPVVAPRPARRAPAQSRPAETNPPPAVAPVEPERPPVRALVPAEEQKRLQDSAQTRKREARTGLAQAQNRRLSSHERDLVKRIEFFLKESDLAEQRGDMTNADALADRAQTLARELQSGR
jgi:hypothetical protein